MELLKLLVLYPCFWMILYSRICIISVENRVIHWIKGFYYKILPDIFIRVIKTNLFFVGANAYETNGRAQVNAIFSMLFPGLSFLAMAGIMLLTTQFQVANLYTAARGKVLCLFNGAMDSSSSAALVIYQLYSTFGYKITWLLYGLLTALILLRSLFLLPKTQIPYEGFRIGHR